MTRMKTAKVPINPNREYSYLEAGESTHAEWLWTVWVYTLLRLVESVANSVLEHRTEAEGKCSADFAGHR